MFRLYTKANPSPPGMGTKEGQVNVSQDYPNLDPDFRRKLSPSSHVYPFMFDGKMYGSVEFCMFALRASLVNTCQAVKYRLEAGLSPSSARLANAKLRLKPCQEARWDRVKLNLIKEVTRAQLEDNEEMVAILLATKHAKLYSHDSNKHKPDERLIWLEELREEFANDGTL